MRGIFVAVAPGRDRIKPVGLTLIISLHAQIIAALANQRRIEPWQRADNPTVGALAQRADGSLFRNEAHTTPQSPNVGNGSWFTMWMNLYLIYDYSVALYTVSGALRHYDQVRLDKLCTSEARRASGVAAVQSNKTTNNKQQKPASGQAPHHDYPDT
jgi:hypothetical protein